MKLQAYPPVEPLWPYGTVAHFYVKANDEHHFIGVRELIVRHVERVGNGWRVMADLQDTMFDPEGRQYVFEVDDHGESANCVPWDDDLEQEYNPRPGVQVSPEPPTRYGDPGVPSDGDVWEVLDRETGAVRRETFDPDGGWTIKESAPPEAWKEVVSSGINN